MKDSHVLSTVCDDIELITGIKTVVYDENGQVIYSTANLMCDFCKEIRRSKKLTDKCLACDRQGLLASMQSQDICIYHCHMDLIEAVAPVIENGRAVGYLMLGQLLPEGGRELVRKKIASLDSEVDKRLLYSHLDKMSEIDEKHLRATARILAMSAAYVRFHEWLKRLKNTTAYKIENYVFENLANQSLSAQSVGTAIGFSRTALYKICMDNFGMGISQYIRKTRVDHAIRLLRTTNLSLDIVAERVGFTSTAQLTRVLKCHTGKTAKAIRKQSV